METQKRIFGYDLIKATAIFFVVFYHLKSLDFGHFQDNGYYIPNITKFLFAFCSAGVPLFFMVNGALQYEKPTTWRKCFDRSFRLIGSSVCWGALFMFILSPWLRGTAYPSLGEFENYYWFLYTLAALYWITFILNKVKGLRISVILLLSFFPFFTNLLWDVLLAINPEREVPGWGHSGCFTMFCVVYYYLGAYLNKNTIHPITSWFCILFGLILVNAEVMVMSMHYKQIYDGVNAAFPTLGAMLISMGLFSLLKKVEMKDRNRIKKVLSLVGSNTMSIYLFHLFLVLLAKEYLFHNEKQNVIVVLLVTVAIIGITIVLSYIIKQTPLRCLLKI